MHVTCHHWSAHVSIQGALQLQWSKALMEVFGANSQECFDSTDAFGSDLRDYVMPNGCAKTSASLNVSYMAAMHLTG